MKGELVNEECYMPNYYPLFVAADRCNCPPWELLKQGVWWRDTALKVASGENWAAELRAKYPDW